MHLKASMATQTNITATHSGWSGYFINEAICGRKAKTTPTNSNEVPATERSVVLYTVGACSSLLLTYLKKVVSMP